MPASEFTTWLLLEEAILAVLSVAFLAWAGVVWRASRLLAEKFDKMSAEFHTYSIRTEHRLTKLEEKEARVFSLIKEIGDRFDESQDDGIGK